MNIQTEIYGITNVSKKAEDLISKLGISNKIFEIRLVLTELIMNAHEHGNLFNSELPINVLIEKKEEKLEIKVSDLGLKEKPNTIKKSFTDDELMNENGRGLFIANELSDELLIHKNTITSIFNL